MPISRFLRSLIPTAESGKNTSPLLRNGVVIKRIDRISHSTNDSVGRFPRLSAKWRSRAQGALLLFSDGNWGDGLQGKHIVCACEAKNCDSARKAIGLVLRQDRLSPVFITSVVCQGAFAVWVPTSCRAPSGRELRQTQYRLRSLRPRLQVPRGRRPAYSVDADAECAHGSARQCGSGIACGACLSDL